MICPECGRQYARQCECGYVESFLLCDTCAQGLLGYCWCFDDNTDRCVQEQVTPEWITRNKAEIDEVSTQRAAFFKALNDLE